MFDSVNPAQRVVEILSLPNAKIKYNARKIVAHRRDDNRGPLNLRNWCPFAKMMITDMTEHSAGEGGRFRDPINAQTSR